MNNNETLNYWGVPIFNKRRTCMLMITHACNLNCTYCYESHKCNKYMSVDLAKELILKECDFVASSPDFDELEIDFMGGEPMMNFPLIKEVVEWAVALPLSVPFVFFLTTNATLFDDEKKAWFKKNKEYVVAGASYDGTTEMQQTNRDTKTGSIDREFFRSTWPYQGFHMTISQETLPHLAEGILEMQRSGYKLDAALAQGIAWNDSDAHKYYEQLQILKEAYLADQTLPPIVLLSRPVEVMDSQNIDHVHQAKWCGSGVHMCTYDIDGTAYGCHMFTPLVLGEKAKKRDDFDWKCSESTDDPFCHECILKMNCPTCAGFNYRFRNSLACRDHRWCKMIFIEKLVSCEFQIKLLSNKRLNWTAEDAARAKGALTAYELLKQFDLNQLESPFLAAAETE